MENKKPIRLRCKHCGREWDYNGNNPYYATCTKCLRKVNVKNGTIENATTKENN